MTITDDQRLYVIGDIHGRSDLLDRIIQKIGQDLANNPTETATTVTLGDYFDRGPDSRGVLDRLVSTGRTFVVVDTVGAGQGEMVLIVQGSSARLTPETEKLPIDAAIVGIVDTVNVENETIFSARGA